MPNVRMQFELPADKARELEALIDECGIVSKKDFFNDAITLFKWAARHTKKGNVIAAVDEKAEKYTEVAMPFIDHLRERLLKQNAQHQTNNG